MPCEPYQNALVQAAASGAELRGELRAHLAACPACRAAFDDERSLLASIDAGLAAAVNVEVPASLLPRVRTRIAEEPASNRGWTPSWLTLAGAAGILVAFLAAQVFWRTNHEPAPIKTATNTNSPAPKLQPPRDTPLNVAPPGTSNPTPPSRSTGTRSPVQQNPLARLSSAPAVLVPQDQEALLFSYAEEWNQRKRAPLVATNFDATSLSLLQVAPIQIGELGVKLLADEKSQ